MIAEIRRARAEFYRRTGQEPTRIRMRKAAYLMAMSEAVGELTVEFLSGTVTLCGMEVEECPDLKRPFEVL